MCDICEKRKPILSLAVKEKVKENMETERYKIILDSSRIIVEKDGETIAASKSIVNFCPTCKRKIVNLEDIQECSGMTKKLIGFEIDSFDFSLDENIKDKFSVKVKDKNIYLESEKYGKLEEVSSNFCIFCGEDFRD